MKTITIKEFRNLESADSPGRTQYYGRFGMSMKSQKKQCENLKVGDTVFYLDTKDKGKGEDNIPQVDVITQATVVDDTVSFKGTKLPVRNELEN